MLCPDEDLSKYDCYALECDPVRSRMLAANHFRELELRSEANTLALMTAASQGKSIKAEVPTSDNHWLLTTWGVQWWELSSRYRGAMYGGRFTRRTSYSHSPIYRIFQ